MTKDEKRKRPTFRLRGKNVEPMKLRIEMKGKNT